MFIVFFMDYWIKDKVVKRELCVVLVLAPMIMALTYATADSASTSIDSVSKPSADVSLSFVRPGLVAEVRVKEGDAVKEGDLLARLNDDAEQIQFQQLKAQAEHTERVAAASADLAQKRVDLKKLEAAKADGAVSDWEIEHAKLSVRIAEISLQLAQFEHEQERRRFEEAKAQLDRMRILSPISGRVEQVDIEPGESAQALAPVIRIVKVNPLWADVSVPTILARRLKHGQAVSVGFPNSEGQVDGEHLPGSVRHISAVAVAASDTLRVRVEVPNAAQRPAGERIHLILEPGDSVVHHDRSGDSLHGTANELTGNILLENRQGIVRQ